jgi:DNA-binding CsgD family transcriptional regulator
MLISDVETSDYRGIDVTSSALSDVPCSDEVITAAFMCGWACADEAHLGILPEALVGSLGVAFAEMKVVRPSGTVVHHQFKSRPEEKEAGDSDSARSISFEGPVGAGSVFQLGARVHEERELSARQLESLRRIAALAQKAVATVLVRQHDRRELGNPFDLLSEREWQVCRALEGAESEKEIAVLLNCSAYTVHAHVKRVYLKLHVNGRKEVVELLRSARQRHRRLAARRFGRTDDAA